MGDFEQRGEEAIRFLKSCDINEKTIVMSHHMPSTRCISEQYYGDPLNMYFVSEKAESIIMDKKPMLWQYGHSHISANFILGDTCLFCNPCGYFSVRRNSMNIEFNKNLIITV